MEVCDKYIQALENNKHEGKAEKNRVILVNLSRSSGLKWNKRNSRPRRRKNWKHVVLNHGIIIYKGRCESPLV